MSTNRHPMNSRSRINRRAFLRGTGGIAVALPFLESVGDRSAWAQDQKPVFSFFIVAANGVVQNRFWPSAAGALSEATMQGKGVAPLAPYAADLLMVKGIKWPGGSPGNCGHAQGYVQAITGIAPGSGGNSSTSGGPSADIVISKALNPAGTDPLTLYAGSQRGAYIAERISFTGGQTPARSAQLNPYETYKKLMGLAPAGSAGGTGGGTSGPSEADEILLRRHSVNDVVMDDFTSLLSKANPEDKRRLTNHLEGIRQFEQSLMVVGENANEVNEGSPETAVNYCVDDGYNKTGLDAFKNGVQFNTNGHMIEDLVKLHGEMVALAFACNLNRTATLQWGDGTDGTIYKTNATGGYNTFHKISHRTNSDASAGNDKWAEDAHAEIDVIRMGTLAHVIDAFKARGLFDNSFIYWTNSIADGPSHGFNPSPVIIAGNAGGFFKQGQYLEVGTKNNSLILASAITAAGVPTENFGAGGGQLTDVHA